MVGPVLVGVGQLTEVVSLVLVGVCRQKNMISIDALEVSIKR